MKKFIAIFPVIALFIVSSFAQNISFEVSCDGTTFRASGPVDSIGFPAIGANFYVRGYIYPTGTFAANGDASGVLADGSPEFPNEVIGTWYCVGWFTQDFATAAQGPFVVDAQVYELNHPEFGNLTLSSYGTELVDLDVPFKRAFTGATDSFKFAIGEVLQENIDFNITTGFNYTYSFDLIKE